MAKEFRFGLDKILVDARQYLMGRELVETEALCAIAERLEALVEVQEEIAKLAAGVGGEG